MFYILIEKDQAEENRVAKDRLLLDYPCLVCYAYTRMSCNYLP